MRLPGDNWGATEAERAFSHPCDELAPEPRLRCDRAITIAAPPELVHRWLCQLRVAPYSYDLLDNFGRRSPRQLLDGLDDLEVGQQFMTIFRLDSFEPGASITLTSGHTAVTYAGRPAGEGTRLLVRVQFGGAAGIRRLVIPPLIAGDLVMMRKQLLTLRELAERDAARLSPPRGAGSRGGGRAPLRPTA